MPLGACTCVPAKGADGGNTDVPQGRSGRRAGEAPNHRRAHHSVESDDDGVATRKSELSLSARLVDTNPSITIHPY